jgi:membrane protease YdiL (CAAX protease family)
MNVKWRMRVVAFILLLKSSMTLKGKMANSHVITKMAVWLGSMLLYCIFAMILIAMVMGENLTMDISMYKWMQFLQTIALFLLPAIFIAYISSQEPWQWLGFTKKVSWQSLVWAVAIMLVALPAINLLGYLNQQLSLPSALEGLETWMKNKESEATWLTEMLMSDSSYKGLVINLLLMAVLPAVAEEFTFRGVLQRFFTSKKHMNNVSNSVPHVAIWVTAAVFSAIHMQFYGFVPRMLMGALFGYMLVWTGSLWVPMLMHFVNNAMAVLVYFMVNRAGWDMDKVDAIGTGNTLWLGIVSIVLTIVGIYMFRRSTTMRSASSRISSGN